MDNDVMGALLALVVVIIAGATGYVGAWFKRQTDKANTQIELDKQNAILREELERQNVRERETIRTMLSGYVNDVNRLNGEVSFLRGEQSVWRESLISSQERESHWKETAERLLVEIDGLPQRLIDEIAKNLMLQQKMAGQPNVPAEPDPDLTKLAADVKVAEENVQKKIDAENSGTAP